jgi:hypothetical protein
VAVGAVKGFVFVQNYLHEIFAGGNVVEITNGVAERGVVDGEGLAGLHGVNVYAENHLGAREAGDLHAGFFGAVRREQQKEAAIKGLGALLFAEGYGEAIGGILLAAR